MTAYGAIPPSADDAENSFQEYDVDYVQERQLTRKERINKIMTAGLPILIALFIVVGFGLWTTKALAPAPSKNTIHAIESPTVVDTAPSPTEPLLKPATAEKSDEEVPVVPKHSRTSSDTTKESGGKSCSANPGCKNLGLIGDCCPTIEGVQLGCCS